MTSIEKETGKAIAVVDVARAFENFVRDKLRDLHCDQEAHAVSQ